MVPMAVTMAFELATYALVIGLIYKRPAKSYFSILIALIPAMVIGRIVYALVFFIVMSLTAGTFNLSVVITGLTVEGLPGVIVQLLIVPPIVFAVEKAGLYRSNKR